MANVPLSGSSLPLNAFSSSMTIPPLHQIVESGWI